MTHHAKVIDGRTIELPAEVGASLGLEPGGTLVIEQDGDTLLIKPYRQVVREVQDRLRERFKGYSVDQFLAERKQDWGED